MPKKRIKVSLKIQLERAELKGRKEGMADLFALLSAADAGHIPEDSYLDDDAYEDSDSCFFKARADAALLNAADQNNLELLFFLVKAGANINTVSKKRRTALHCAVEQGDIELVRALLKAGARPNIYSIDYDHYDDVTPLACAIEQGNFDIVKALLKAGADVHSGDEPEQANWLIDYDAEGDQVEITRMLLKAGAYVGLREDGDRTPLMFAAHCGKTKSAALLIEAGADVNAADDYGGETALMLAVKEAKEGTLDTIRLLLKSGAKINHKDKYGRTALMKAAEAGCLEAVGLLLSAGADVFCRARVKSKGTQNIRRWTVNAFDIAKYAAVKEVLKSAMHRCIAAALSALPALPVDVRQRVIRLYTEN